jgi:hypothetical protein
MDRINSVERKTLIFLHEDFLTILHAIFPSHRILLYKNEAYNRGTNRDKKYIIVIIMKYCVFTKIYHFCSKDAIFYIEELEVAITSYKFEFV